MDLTPYAGFGAIPVVVAFVHLIKATVFTSTTPSWTPVVSALVFSVFWCLIIAYALKTDLVMAIVVSVLVWLCSMGAWSGTKNVLGK